MAVWKRKILEITGANLLRRTWRSSRNYLSPETGTGRGRLWQRRKDRETGLSGGFLALVVTV
jgi:hypothetical protein